MSRTCLITSAYPWTLSLVLSVGAFTVVCFLLKTSLVLAQTFVLSGENLKKFGATKGAWAVVTGASDGIGKEFSVQLAAAGFNVLLVARNEGALSAVAAEIKSKTAGKVETQIQLIDFAQNDPAAFNALKSVLGSLNIGVLVNNVGRSYTIPTYFAETLEQEHEDILAVNVASTVRVTRAVLPGMIQRKCGLILNMGSFASEVAAPMIATYSGAKAFISTFTSALAEEVRQHNIIVQHLNTCYVATKMPRIQTATMSVPTPAAYVRSTLRKVGLPCGAALSNRPATSTPFWSHALFDYVIHAIGWKALFVSYSHRMLSGRRAERLAKQQ